MAFSLRSLALGLMAGLAVAAPARPDLVGRWRRRWMSAAAPARADLVVLSSGRVMSASSVVLTVDTATIRLRGGGEVTCDRSLVLRVDPDETPWIDPAGAAAVNETGDPGNATPAPVRAIEIPAAYRDIIT